MQKNPSEAHEPLQDEKHKKVESINDALVKLEGNLRYQKWFSFVLIMIFTSGNRFLTMYPFMQLYPNLKCPTGVSGDYVDCKLEDACANSGKYLIDPQGHVTLENWVTTLDLVCVEKYEIGMMGALLFIG